MKFYGLDPVHYYTAPGFSWDSMLLGYYKLSHIKNLKNKSYYHKRLFIETFNEYQMDMLDMIKNNMRGGTSYISHRYAKANNKYMKEYNPNEKSSYIIYLDANNLYGWAMSQYLPVGNYEWNDKITLKEILKTKANSKKGYIVKCDLKIPHYKHDYFSCYPLAVESTCFDDSPFMLEIKRKIGDKSTNKINKLIPNLFDKKEYVVHYRNLQQYVKLGVIVEKIHCV
jgi:hypothetical protein